jgi:hypothetical protein
VKRPTGITVIAVVYIVLAVLSLLWGGLVLGVSGMGAFFSGLFGAENVAAYSTTSAWSGFVGILAAIVQIAVGIGLLSMKKWAWVLALIGVGLTVIEGIIGVFSGGPFAFMCGSLGLIVPVIILIYLLTNRVRSTYGIGTSQPISKNEGGT